MKQLPRRIAVCALLILLSACDEQALPPVIPTSLPSRYSKIPITAQEMGPENDLFPPLLHNPGWEDPQPMPGPVNSAGGEDSPFITPDGSSFFFFFTPDVSLPAEQQVTDGVTGIYQSYLREGQWSEPERVLLNDGLALDGCPMVVGNQLWFCTVREGLTGLHWFKASYAFGIWGDWQQADFNPAYRVGELHISADGSELYFHSDRPGSQGKNDIWISRMKDGSWEEPENLTAVNSPENDSRPFLSENGQELWFTRNYQGYPAVFVSYRVNGEWGEPTLIVSQFAAEPTLDRDGNLYFVHHFIQDGVMLDADIYLAKKK
jgi:hypothetical protein